MLSVRLPWHRRHRKKLLVGGAVLVVLVAGLGVYSYWFGGVLHVDGFVSPWGLEVSVQDEAGRPVPGAALRLCPRGRGEPIITAGQGAPLKTDGQGRVAYMCKGGSGWGGSVRRLFSVIPIEDFSRPDYDCEVTCPGYRPARFRLDALRDKADRSAANDLHPGKALMAVRIYDRRVVLKRQ